MPNWTFNVITAATDADFKKIVKAAVRKINGKLEFDFSALIAEPKEMLTPVEGQNESLQNGFTRDDKDWNWFLNRLLVDRIKYGHDEGGSVALKAAENKFGVKTNKYRNCVNFVNHGFKYWYDWRIAKWGTKWNAANTTVDKEERRITFDTAWAAPLPVVEALAKTANFIHSWEDEDGTVKENTYLDGKKI